MFENETSEDQTPSGKPPYLFLIPVALGVVGFIGYQTVHMGMGTSVVRSSYTDTSLVQADVQNGVITVHANAASAVHPARAAHSAVGHLAMIEKHPSVHASPTGAPSTAPSTKPSATPEAKSSATPPPEKTTAQQKHPKAHHAEQGSDSGERIASEPVPQIERPISARLASNSSQNSSEATAPPITDTPMVRHDAAVAQAATAAPAPAPAATAKPVVVAQAPAAPAQAGPINASDRIVDAKMSYAAAPDYPDMARDQGVRGTSVVFVTVDGRGAIVHLSIASSSGNGSLDRAALTAARSSQYIAPKVDGKPAIETYRVTYDFAP